MKGLKKILKKPLAFVILAVLGTIIVMALISFILILPKMSEYSKLSVQNRKEGEKLAVLNKNIANYSKLNVSEITNFSKLTKELIPEENDAVRFINLNEIVAKDSGVVVSDASFISSSKASTQKSTNSNQSSSPPTQKQTSRGLLGAVYAQEKNVTQSQGQSTASSGSSYTLKVSVTGGFQNIISYISNFKKVDRLVGISDVTINGSDESGGLSVVINFILPLASSTAVVTPNESIALSDQDREILQSIAEDIKYSASPSKDPLGRPDPFK